MEFLPPGGLTTVVDLAGVFTAGVLGGQVAADKKLDPVGFTALALVSATGGGMLRDILLAQGTPLALVHPSYLITALLAAAVAFLIDLQRGRVGRVALLLVDSLALSFWAVSGSQRATQYGLGTLTCLLLGVITAVGGGVIRDILVGNRPAVFADNATLYATAALAAAGTDRALLALGLVTYAATPISIAVGCAVRLLSLRYGWRLPDSRPDLPTTVKTGIELTKSSLPLTKPRHRDPPPPDEER